MQVFAEILGVPLQDRRYIIELGDRLLGNQDPEYAQPTDESTGCCRSPRPPRSRCSSSAAGWPRRGARRRATTSSPSRVRAADPARVRRLLRTAGDRRQRDDAPHDHARPAGAARASRPAAAPAREPRALQARGRGDWRWATPVHHFRRTTTQGHRAGGRRAARGRGKTVTTWFVSGNRDESVFEDPDTFDVGRTPNKHMAFGPGGIHHCMRASRPDGDQDRVRGAAQARLDDRAGR